MSSHILNKIVSNKGYMKETKKIKNKISWINTKNGLNCKLQWYKLIIDKIDKVIKGKRAMLLGELRKQTYLFIFLIARIKETIFFFFYEWILCDKVMRWSVSLINFERPH